MNRNLRPNCISGIEEIVYLYDAFLIDQWGVIHNGKSLYYGALETLKELAKTKKPVIILTNSSKTKEFNIKRFKNQFGISSNLYTEIISSAELLKELVIKRVGYPWDSFGKKVFIVADGSDADLIQGTDLESVSEIDEADIVMLLSMQENQNINDHQSWIIPAIEKGLSIVCPSADELSVSPNGVFQGMASIVTDYREKGGVVINVGKPEATIYDYCRLLISSIQSNRILSVGDQIYSDVYGAKKQGFHAALVATGATLKNFPLSKTIEDIANEAFSLSNPKSLSPDWILPSLQWGR